MLGSLMGGGGGFQQNSSAKSGDATTGPLSNSQGYGYDLSAAFNVGSGSASGSAGAPPAASNTLLYLAIGISLLGVLMPVLLARRK